MAGGDHGSEDSGEDNGTMHKADQCTRIKLARFMLKNRCTRCGERSSGVTGLGTGAGPAHTEEAPRAACLATAALFFCVDSCNFSRKTGRCRAHPARNQSAGARWGDRNRGDPSPPTGHRHKRLLSHGDHITSLWDMGVHSAIITKIVHLPFILWHFAGPFRPTMNWTDKDSRTTPPPVWP